MNSSYSTYVLKVCLKDGDEDLYKLFPVDNWLGQINEKASTKIS